MGDAIWSTPPGDMLDYPAQTFLRFCDNHGLLHITGKPLWLSVKGGARALPRGGVASVLGRGLPLRACREDRAHREPACASPPPHAPATTTSPSGDASAADAQQILGDAMSAAEREVLGRSTSGPTTSSLHTERRSCRRASRAWASWNWYAETGDIDKAMLMLTYQCNTLQSRRPRHLRSWRRSTAAPRARAGNRAGASSTFDHPMYSAERSRHRSTLPTNPGRRPRLLRRRVDPLRLPRRRHLVRRARRRGDSAPTCRGRDQLDESRTRTMPGAPIPMLGQTRTLLPGEQGEIAPGRAAAVAGRAWSPRRE